MNLQHQAINVRMQLLLLELLVHSCRLDN